MADHLLDATCTSLETNSRILERRTKVMPITTYCESCKGEIERVGHLLELDGEYVHTWCVGSGA